MTTDPLEDLVPALTVDPTTGACVGLRTGVLVAFDDVTGANTVRVSGWDLSNLPYLRGAVTSADAGQTVTLLTTGPAWFILGRVRTP